MSGDFSFSIVATSLAYMTIPKEKRKRKITRDKKINYNIYIKCPGPTPELLSVLTDIWKLISL